MAEIRNVNIDKEFIVKFGVCRTNFSDDMLSISLEVLPEAIKEVLQETMVEDGEIEITVTPVKRGFWEPISESEMTGFNPKFAGRDPIAGYKCSNCGNEAIFSCNDEFVLSDYCPDCGEKMDGGKSDE